MTAAAPLVLRASTERDLVHVNHGQPLTTSRRVAQRFGKRHDNVLRSIRVLCDDLPPGFARLNFEGSTYTGEDGASHPEYLLTQDGFLALAMGFTGKDAAALRAGFIEAFGAMARALQRQQRQRLAPEWQAARAAVARQHTTLNEVLTQVRSAAGKPTQAHHLANEARLIGYAMTGVHAGLDRDTLDADQLRTLQRVEARDVILIARGADHEARKAELRALVAQQQQPHEAARPELADGCPPGASLPDALPPDALRLA